jgi:hypothetical protein
MYENYIAQTIIMIIYLAVIGFFAYFLWLATRALRKYLREK